MRCSSADRCNNLIDAMHDARAIAEALEPASQPATIGNYLERAEGMRVALEASTAAVAAMLDDAKAALASASNDNALASKDFAEVAEAWKATIVAATLERVYNAALLAQISAKTERVLMTAAYAVCKGLSTERDRAHAFGSMCECAGVHDEDFRERVYTAMCAFV